jgi:hypothetical protein
MSEGTIPGIRLSTKGKTILTIVVMIAAVCLVVSSSIKFESNNKPGGSGHPPPTYTGSAPLTINNEQEAKESNNDFILVFTPCSDEALNASVLDITISAADRIRSIDRIYVGVFTLPRNNSLAYPTVMVRYLKTGIQYTFRSDVTEDAIFNQYLNYKFMH